MSVLIPYAPRQVGDVTIQTVDGRHIHAFLAIARDYSDWVKRQIKSGQLIENRDFTIFYNHVEKAKGRPSTEYHFTFRSAEHIGMMSRTSKGKEIREYFLALEDQAHNALPQTPTPAEAALAIAQAVVAIERRQAAIEARQDAQDVRLQALTERQPPAGRLSPVQWLKQYGKPRLPREVLDNFRAACRRTEEAVWYRPESFDYQLPYYTPETLARAYAEATKQLSFLLPAPEERQRRRR